MSLTQKCNILEKRIVDCLKINDYSSFIPIKIGGSSREYYRIKNFEDYILVKYQNLMEMKKFCFATEFLLKNEVIVQKIFVSNEEYNFLIIEDVGTKSLYEYYQANKHNFKNCEKIYVNVLDELKKFQHIRKKTDDLILHFDLSVLKWETDYFIEMVLKKYLKIECDYQEIERYMNDLNHFSYKKSDDFLIHRDFQSQNLHLKNEKIYFIDYQSLHYGSKYYDAVSLIEDPYVNLDSFFKQELYNYFCKSSFDEEQFNAIRLQRLMQANAAYVKLGLILSKKWFIQFIDPTLRKVCDLILLSEISETKIKKIFFNIKKNLEE